MDFDCQKQSDVCQSLRLITSGLSSRSCAIGWSPASIIADVLSIKTLGPLSQDVLHDSFEALKYDASALHAFEEERADWEAAQQLARALEAQQRQEEEDFMLAHRLAGLRVPATRTRESSSTASSPRSSIDDAGPSTLSAGSSFASTSESSSSVQNKVGDLSA